MAELRFFGYLTDLAGTRAKEVTLEKPTKLRDIVPLPFPESDMVILINQQAGSLDSMVSDEDSVVIMPMLSGG